MTTIYPMTQSLFVNRQAESASQQTLPNGNEAIAKTDVKKVPLEGEYFKIGDSASYKQAESMFANANQYAQMSKNEKNGLQAYTSLDTDSKRDDLRRLMGVDLYA